MVSESVFHYRHLCDMVEHLHGICPEFPDGTICPLCSTVSNAIHSCSIYCGQVEPPEMGHVKSFKPERAIDQELLQLQRAFLLEAKVPTNGFTA